MWAKGSGELSPMWCLLHDLQAAGTDLSSHLGGRGRHGMPPQGPVSGLCLRPQSPKGLAKKKTKTLPQSFPILTEEEKHKQGEDAQEPFPVKRRR